MTWTDPQADSAGSIPVTRSLDRSPLSATLKVMESLRRADQLRAMQAANHRRLAERGISPDDLPDLIRVYKGSGP
jgi:hypothetical protein